MQSDRCQLSYFVCNRLTPCCGDVPTRDRRFLVTHVVKLPTYRLPGSLEVHFSGMGVLRQIGFEQANFRVARDASAVGNGKQRKARSADTEPHAYCEPRFIENGFVARVRAVGVV